MSTTPYTDQALFDTALDCEDYWAARMGVSVDWLYARGMRAVADGGRAPGRFILVSVVPLSEKVIQEFQILEQRRKMAS